MVVFRSLPIQFDAYGRAHLRDEEAEAPFNFTDDIRRQRALQRERALEKLFDHPSVSPFTIDPVTRTQAPLALHLVLDFEQRRVLETRIEGGEFNPHELIVRNRKASEAVPITSRNRGASSGAHAIASAMALEMAGGITPPPLAIMTRNLGACGEMVSDCARQLFLHAGPDYAEAIVSRTNPAIWQKARKSAAPGAAVHGHESMADLMRGLNPLQGSLYLEAMQMSRWATEIATLVFGKSPHPSTIFPGGNGIEASRETFNQILGRVNTILDYAKKVAAVWDDLVEFFYDVEPKYRRVGELAGNFLSVGLWEDPEAYDANYANCNEWGARRYSVPGILVNSEKRTNRLSDLNIGIEEFVDHAYYAEWNHQRFATDPMSNPLSPWHPWNKETIPVPATRDLQSRYTWLPTPRWDREPMESGSIARLWINAVNRNQNCEFITPVRQGLEINIPKGQQPPKRLTWNLPERPNALERNRAGAYQIAFAGMVAYANLLTAFECLRRGETRMSNRFLLPEKSLGVGFWESGSGAITHHVAVKNQAIANYQIIGPVDWICSSRDASGVPGIMETAIMNTPILEECRQMDDFTGIDILRVIRSFAP